MLHPSPDLPEVNSRTVFLLICGAHSFAIAYKSILAGNGPGKEALPAGQGPLPTIAG